MSDRTLLFLDKSPFLVDVESGKRLIKLTDFELDRFLERVMFPGTNLR